MTKGGRLADTPTVDRIYRYILRAYMAGPRSIAVGEVVSQLKLDRAVVMLAAKELRDRGLLRRPRYHGVSMVPIILAHTVVDGVETIVTP